VAAQKFLETQCHEFDAFLNFDEYGLKPYYGLTSFRKEHDWVGDGKPSTTFEFDGQDWAVVLDYDDQPIIPWSDPSYKLETAYLYRVYLVCMDETYDDESADASQRVKGGTFTVYPRWPDMKKQDDETGAISKVNGYMDLGRPYLTVRAQASNIDFEKYVDLMAEAFAAFDVPRRYFSNPHESSNINDAAMYVRPKRDISGPVYAADGPIARIHQLLESDRSGYRKHVEDNRERPGDYVTATIDSGRASKLIRGHTIGKEVKHYYMRNPDNYSPEQFGWHPKLEVSFQTSVTDETIYWDRENAPDLEQCRRELDETLMNVLDWAGLDVLGGDEYHEDAYFDPESRSRRSLKLVDCPLPEIESEQENAVMRLWGDMNGSDRALTELLLTDGGEVSPKDAAEKTGYSYRTVRRVVDRLEGFVRHTYGKLEVESDFAAKEMLKRVRSAEEQFQRTIGATAMQVAEDASGFESGPFDRFKRSYEVGVRETVERTRKLLQVRYTPEDREEALDIAREAVTGYEQQYDDELGISGIWIAFEYADGSSERIHLPKIFDLSKALGKSGRSRDTKPMDKTRKKLLEERESLPRRMKKRSIPGG
jgi:hypothetical protein